MIKFLILILFTACSSQTVKVEPADLLPYKDSSAVTKLDPGLASLALESVRDMRASKEMGFAYTGVKYSKTPIVLSSSLEEFLTDYFIDQLEMRNVEVLNDSPTKLTVSVVNFQVYELVEQFKPERAKCELQIDFELNQDAKKWSGSFATEYVSAGDITDGTERLAPSMASCLNNLTEKMINDQEFINFFKNRE